MITSPRRALAALLLASTSLATFSSAAYAQSEEIVLDEIVVEASTGSKIPVAITKVPQSISMISSEELAKLPGVKADETLRYSSGVNTTTYGTDSDTDWFAIRGFQAEQTGMFLDGMQLYQIGFGTAVIEPFLLDRIEVLKGPASSLYGGANVGGIVNYISKRPTGERLRYTETGVNSHGNAYVGFDIGDATETGGLSYRLTGKVSGGGWETEDAQDLRGNILGAVTWKPTEATELTVYAHYQNADMDHTSTGFLPYYGTVEDGPNGVRIPRDLNYGEPAFDVYERQQAMLGYEIEHELNADWTVRQKARYVGLDVNEDSIYPTGDYSTNPATPTELRRQRWAHHTEAQIGTIDTQLEGIFDTGPVSHTLVLGLDYKNYWNNPESYYNNSVEVPPGWVGAPPNVTPNLDPLNPSYGSLPYTAPDLAQGTITMMQQAGLYAEDQLSFENWLVTLNGRYDFARTELDAVLDSGDHEREEGVFTGRVGVGYEFDNGLTPYVSYATSFLPQLAQDIDGNLLPSETGEQWEAGIKYEPTFMDGVITASVFNLTRDNVAAPDQTPGVWASLPVGEVNVKGAELEALVRFENFGVRGALTYLDAEIINSTRSEIIGKTPVLVPTLTASLGVEYSFDDNLEGLTVGAGMRYLGESQANDTNTLQVPDATLFDASIRYQKDDWGVSLNASNLLDTTYVQGCQSQNVCGYGAGRQVTLSLSKNW